MPVCYLREQNKKLPPRVSVYFIQLHYILATNGEKRIKFVEEDCNTHGIFVVKWNRRIEKESLRKGSKTKTEKVSRHSCVKENGKQ